MARPLRHGYTTGACAAAATLGAARLLAGQKMSRVEILLPAGESAIFTLHDCLKNREGASCFVVKDAGDDPDITHGVEVHAQGERLSPSPREGGGRSEGDIEILGGTGIGRVTKPGLAVAVGEAAINPVPRQMIVAALRSIFPRGSFRVILAIPDGEQRATKTLNARLGILGGLSILGTTGIVRPISHQAWTDTLEVALDVALAAGCEQLVACTGRSSEKVAQAFLPALPEEAFVMMGDHVGYLAGACHRKGVPRLLIAAQFAKLVKIACGHSQTHVCSSELDLGELAGWAGELGFDPDLVVRIGEANTAREILSEVGPGHPLVAEVAARAVKQLQNWAIGVKIEVLLIGYAGMVVGQFE